ncbi:glycoside hydrolase family 27 protein [Novosphingobium sp. 1949]|uniref:Alpha-galactosidase n=1 Tax=Novosphingobium organovorum TaxID=2930092 RepID=A0ABT0BHX3_9SPHN|nr:glycoside hydrolase family 27 protein [Novosphingobium organovorum]MCJ2184662.1 glycoside hydrolase family 27 protein [Novosphingobium organovorum]
MNRRLATFARRALLALATLALPLAQAHAEGDTPAPNRTPPSLDPARTANGLAPTPPMGWNSWNRFACTISEATIRQTADAMVSSGMRDAGYTYVVIDDCWHGERDAQGFIHANAKAFPSGIKALADYIHAKGLKFGIYSDAGMKTCGGRPGSQGHEYQDAQTYASWGVDYLKYDWCATGSRNSEEAYALMEDALRATGRPIVFSLCEWGSTKPWLWGAKIGNLWRTTGDITDKWSGKHGYAYGMLDIVDRNEPLWPYAGPGHWNDPDMLEVGNGGMTTTEYRAHFALWAMMAAPLIAGNDVAKMDPATAGILLNREVIAIDQDPLGRQGRRVRRDGSGEVWVRTLANGARAALLFNRGDTPVTLTLDWSALDYAPDTPLAARDVWAHSSLGTLTGRWQTSVAPHDVVMLRLTPAPLPTKKSRL